MSVEFNLTFLGAAGTVTGSSYLLEIQDSGEIVTRVLIDHGLFQGPDVEAHNREPYPFDAAAIEFLFLTHAHIDHCGRIPLLAQKGFTGKIFATRSTTELCELILPDSAKVQLQEFQNYQIPTLYSHDDVFRALQLFEEVEYETIHEVDYPQGTLTFQYFQAGHILGAASIKIAYKDKSILFSGDIGRRTQEIVPGFSTAEKQADYVVMESLYGGKFHENKEEMYRKFIQRIKTALERNGNVIIPTFAIQRAQEVLMVLNQSVSRQQLPTNVQIFLDSPLASKVTNVYTQRADDVDFAKLPGSKSLARALFSHNVSVVKKYSQTQKIKRKQGSIVVTGSGMCNGGKVLDYLKSQSKDPKNLLAIMGFQAEDTLGRQIIEGAEQIEIDGQTYPMKMEVEQFAGFSAHGDQDDLLSWLATVPKGKLQQVFLVHAELEQSESFSRVLEKQGLKTHIPKLREAVKL